MPSTEEHYAAYQADPSQENLVNVVDSLKPTMRYALSGFGAADDPVLAGKARLIAADAVKSWNPKAGAKLATHLTNQLQQLSRETRKYRSVAQVPERAQLDQYALYRAEQELKDKHGRDPSVDELADHTGMSIKRIEKVRRLNRVTPSEIQFGDDGLSTSQEPDYLHEAIQYVHGESDYPNKKILEWSLGWGGEPVLPGTEIAKRLKLSEANLSRRTAILRGRVAELEDALKTTA